MWKPAVSGMEEAHICAKSKYRRIRRYLVCRLKRPEARDFSHVRFTVFIHGDMSEKTERIMCLYHVEEKEAVKNDGRYR